MYTQVLPHKLFISHTHVTCNFYLHPYLSSSGLYFVLWNEMELVIVPVPERFWEWVANGVHVCTHLHNTAETARNSWNSRNSRNNRNNTEQQEQKGTAETARISRNSKERQKQQWTAGTQRNSRNGKEQQGTEWTQRNSSNSRNRKEQQEHNGTAGSARNGRNSRNTTKQQEQQWTAGTQRNSRNGNRHTHTQTHTHTDTHTPYNLLPKLPMFMIPCAGTVNECQFIFYVQSFLVPQRLRGTTTYMIKDWTADELIVHVILPFL